MTPQLGKRKRATPKAAPDAPNEEDELSPDRPENVASVEKSRRLARSVSPVSKEPTEAPDELSVIDEVPVTARKTPGLVTGLIDASEVPASSRRNVPRRSKSTDVVPVTPGMQPHGSSKHSFVLSTTVENTASDISQTGDEVPDELPPSNDDTVTPRVVSRRSIPNEESQDWDGDIDELSPRNETASATIALVTQTARKDPVATPVPIKKTKRKTLHSAGRASKALETVTPAKRDVGKKRSQKAPIEAELDSEQPDELSPKAGRMTQTVKRPARQSKEATPVAEDESVLPEEGADSDNEPQSFTPRPAAKRTPPNKAQHAKPSSDKPPRKRQKSLGPRLAISVLRMKGHGVRGISMADTTRTILEEAIDHRLGRMLEKVQTSQDSARRKEMRSEVNLALSFKESLSEKLLDLQDANDVLTTNLKKLKLFKRDNVDLRKDILALQNGRQEIALEHDDVQAEFEAEKAKVEARNTLSAIMFDIENAVQNGRKKAIQDRREHEGPDVPLSMLLDTVGRDAGSVGGGLLANVKSFNSTLERAAGWLEGRA